MHAKDTRIDPANAAVNSLIDTVPSQQVRDRTWGYVTLGLWARRGLVARVLPGLNLAGSDDVLQIEHEDLLLTPRKACAVP